MNWRNTSISVSYINSQGVEQVKNSSYGKEILLYILISRSNLNLLFFFLLITLFTYNSLKR